MKSEEDGGGLSSLVTGSYSYSNFASVQATHVGVATASSIFFSRATYNVMVRWVETSAFCAFLVVYDVGACNELTLLNLCLNLKSMIRLITNYETVYLSNG